MRLTPVPASRIRTNRKRIQTLTSYSRLAGQLASVGTVAQGIGVVAGLCLWGFGLWWLALATLITIRYWRAGVPFNLGWWGYTFPIGVYAVATLRLANIFPLPALTGFGGVLVAALAAIWVVVAIRTSCGAYNGSLFVDPCLES